MMDTWFWRLCGWLAEHWIVLLVVGSFAYFVLR